MTETFIFTSQAKVSSYQESRSKGNLWSFDSGGYEEELYWPTTGN